MKDDTLALRYVVQQNAEGKIIFLKNDDEEFSFQLHLFYDKKGNLISYQNESADLMDKTPLKEIKIINYDDFGNLLNEFNYTLKNKIYQAAYYKEYTYQQLNRQLFVYVKTLQHHAIENIILKETLIFDEFKRRTSYRSVSNAKRNKKLYNDENFELIREQYFYEDKKFPDFITKIVNESKKSEAHFTFYPSGMLRKFENNAENDQQFRLQDISEGDTIFKIHTFRKVNRETVYDRSYIQTYDLQHHLIFERSIKDQSDLLYEKRNEYQFDENKNWIYRKTIIKHPLPQETRGMSAGSTEITARKIEYHPDPDEKKDFARDPKAQILLQVFLEAAEFTKR